LHFTAFHPDYKLTEIPPTPAATLRRARALAMGEGLRFVYTGNVHDAEGDATRCAACGTRLIQRDWYELLEYRLTADGCCPRCRTPLPGRFAPHPEHFGARRIPVAFRHAGEASSRETR